MPPRTVPATGKHMSIAPSSSLNYEFPPDIAVKIDSYNQLWIDGSNSDPQLREALATLWKLIGTVSIDEVFAFLDSLPEENFIENIIFESPLLKGAQRNEQINLYLMREKPSSTAGTEKCGRCGSKNVTGVEVKMRSADEAQPIFYTCTDCGKKWRQG